MNWAGNCNTTRASGCKTCALKNRCTRNQANRTITREANEHLMEAMAPTDEATAGQVQVKEDPGRTSFRHHQALFWLHALLLKGLVKVQTEWSLTTLAYNLKRVLNLVGFQKLMAAVG